MAGQFGSEVLDKFLAPGISAFNKADVPSLESAYPDADHWISNHFLNSLFGHRYNDDWRQITVTFIFRVQNALRAYRIARMKTLDCANGFQPGRPKVNLYFEAVSQWEVALLNTQIALDLFFKVMDPSAVETDDAARVRRTAARIKHFAEDIAEGKNTPELTLPMWLSSDRLNTRTTHVTFNELAENLTEMGRAAEIMQNPGQISDAVSAN